MRTLKSHYAQRFNDFLPVLLNSWDGLMLTARNTGLKSGVTEKWRATCEWLTKRNVICSGPGRNESLRF